MAYGRAGSEESLAVRDVRQVAEQYLTGGKMTLVWPEGVPSEHTAEQRGYLKTILNVIVLAEETLAYGGVITVRGLGEGELGCRVEVVGRNAHLSEAMQAALSGSAEIEDLSPRTIQAYVTGRFASHFGFSVTYDHSIPDRLDLILSASTEAKTEAEPGPVVIEEDDTPEPMVQVV